jgi:hypothetical protein
MIGVGDGDAGATMAVWAIEPLIGIVANARMGLSSITETLVDLA